MKLRVITYRKQKYILCPNGSKLKANKENLNRLLSDFRKPSSFKGEDGYWNDTVASMEDAAGETLAFVDDSLSSMISFMLLQASTIFLQRSMRRNMERVVLWSNAYVTKGA